jgi:hypothetical protein
MIRQWEIQTGSLSPTSRRRTFNEAVAETFTKGQSRKTLRDLKNCSTKIQAETDLRLFR